MSKLKAVNLELLERLVERTTAKVNAMALDETPEEVEKMMKYPSDLRTLLAAAKAMNEPETQKFLMILTGIFSTANPLYMIMTKELLDMFSDKLMAATVILQKDIAGESDCDGDCDNRSKEEETTIEKLDVIGRA